MSVFVRQGKIAVRIGFQSDPIDRTKMRLWFANSHILHWNICYRSGYSDSFLITLKMPVGYNEGFRCANAKAIAL